MICVVLTLHKFTDLQVIASARNAGCLLFGSCACLQQVLMSRSSPDMNESMRLMYCARKRAGGPLCDSCIRYPSINYYR